jgi:probable rRNA maturation factor
MPFGLQPMIELTLTLTDDARIQQLNRDYRGQDRPTDVLSFSQIEGDPEFIPAPNGTLNLGDVIISVETAERQAKGELIDELRLLAVHGALHLLGYDHETDDEEARMNRLTEQALTNSV